MPNNENVADFLEAHPGEATCLLDGKLIEREAAIELLRSAHWFENGIVRDDGDEVWFSGHKGDTHYSLVVRGWKKEQGNG
jgi:hypothetical protein